MKKLLVVDFEFTVYKQRIGRPRAFFQEIIEVGAALLTPPDFQPREEYQAFVKPRFYPRLTEDCKTITMIRQSDVDGGIPLEDILGPLQARFQPGETLLVAWGPSDREVLGNVCQRYGLEYPFPWEDYVDLAEEFKTFYKKERRFSVKDAAEDLGLALYGVSHSALDDAVNTGKIAGKMLADGWILPQLRE